MVNVKVAGIATGIILERIASEKVEIVKTADRKDKKAKLPDKANMLWKSRIHNPAIEAIGWNIKKPKGTISSAK